MKKIGILRSFTSLTIIITLFLGLPQKISAHCDGLDGPVVYAAKKALETGNVVPVLIWVQKKDEKTIEDAFRKTLDLRKLGPQAKELADTHFFETLVRVHRAGEGAPYTGLKPAGRDIGPVLPAADKAMENGKIEPLAKLLRQLIEQGLHEQFAQVMAKKDFKQDDPKAGREFVAAYVTYIHYVERLYEAVKQGAHGHYPEGEGEEVHGQAGGRGH